MRVLWLKRDSLKAQSFHQSVSKSHFHPAQPRLSRLFFGLNNLQTAGPCQWFGFLRCVHWLNCTYIWLAEIRRLWMINVMREHVARLREHGWIHVHRRDAGVRDEGWHNNPRPNMGHWWRHRRWVWHRWAVDRRVHRHHRSRWRFGWRVWGIRRKWL